MCDDEPIPAEANVSVPGFALAAATRSATLLNPSDLRGDQHVRLHAEHRHRHEGLRRVIRQASVQHHSGAERRRTHNERVAIRIGFGDVVEADDPTRAGLGLDHHRLAEQPRDLVQYDTADGVRRTAGGKRADHPDRPARPIVGPGRRCGKQNGYKRAANPCAQ